MDKERVIRAARTAHEVNRIYCMALGDDSQPEWEDAPAWQKESAFNGAKAILANPDQPPRASHDNWLKEKIETGWKYGPIKDPDKKEHPCIVDYYKLPVDQRRKDTLFTLVVKAVLGV